jgi:hypothetical protein
MRGSRWPIWALLIWIVTGVLLAFFERPLYDALWIMAGFLELGFIFLGVVLLCIVAYYGVRHRSFVVSASALGFIFSGLALWYMAPLITAKGDAAIFWFRFTKNRPTYDRIVAEVEQAPTGSFYGEREGVCYQVDAKQSIRVAFPQPGGILDNWEGVIYDPTGEVLKARGWAEPGVVSAPPGVRELFGSDLVSCRHVEGHYYRCWFT